MGHALSGAPGSSMIHRKAEGDWEEKEEIDVISTEEVEEDEEDDVFGGGLDIDKVQKGWAEEVEHMRKKKNLPVLGTVHLRCRHACVGCSRDHWCRAQLREVRELERRNM